MTATAPTVSVIIPTYQRRELVKRAIASVFAQSYRDFEVIVVDDGSADRTSEALAPLGARIRYRRQPNRGVAAARNAGIAIARGSIVAFLDSDDRWLPEHLAVLTGALARYPEAVLASTCPERLIGGRQGPESARLVEPFPRMFFAVVPGYPSCVAVSRSALDAIGGFDERFPVAEDVDLWLRLAIRGRFVTVQRRTVVKQYTDDGLKHTARRRGDYLKDVLDPRTTDARWDREAVRGLAPSELAAQARGSGELVAALRALDQRDDRAVKTALENACRLLPELSRDPEAVEHRLRLLPRAHEPIECFRHFATTARLWPDPCADTALFLRGRAILIALRGRRVAEAVGLIRRWPLSRTPAFLRRTFPAILSLARQSLDEYLHAGHEPAAPGGHSPTRQQGSKGGGRAGVTAAPGKERAQ
jgi:Glycosyl transferase family 2